ncbi:TPA: phospholipase D family protein [Listeria monocytogenes]|nr:NgoFVII family restriction endonuclease [Listeria monocytogenes]HAA9071010.1 hypothetical protein [Listeria monocytogenes]HDI4828563.1 phospholipase D family protein [Listeria monocytogenes]HDM9928144.1 phospholipase D family protein [Listeria monocytogenes]
MVLYTNNLYEHIIETEAPNFSALRIVSGYGSATFLKKVIKDFPHLSIELYLGMTFQGISQKNHEEYCSLMRKNNIDVYYQVEGIQNHMKLVEFKTPLKTKTFIGSANFTENGFINQRELMSEVEDETDAIFSYQAELSLKANTEDINNYITFFEDEESNIDGKENCREKTEIKSNDTDYPLEKRDRKFTTLSESKLKKYRALLNSMRSSANPEYFRTFDIEIVLDENNPRWSDTGINSWVVNKKPVLVQTPRVLFDNVFPTDKIVEIYTDDGNHYQGKLTGRFDGNFVLIDGNLYDYVRERIGLKKIRPISREDLVIFGCTKLHFERIEETKYFMSFGLND